MENDRNDQAVMIVSGDFLIGVRGAAARRREFFERPHSRRLSAASRTPIKKSPDTIMTA